MTTPAGSTDGTGDAREGSGDPTTDPAAAGEVRFENPDGDGGAVPAPEREIAQQG